MITRFADVEQQTRAMDRVLSGQEERMEESSSMAVRFLLDRMLERVDGGLTASSLPLPFGVSELFSLSDVSSWWAEAVNIHLREAVIATWTASYLALSDRPISSASLASAGDYVAQVSDRLSRTAQPLVPDQAFDLVRVGLIDEIGRGSPTETIARRVASDLSWTGPDRPFWEQRPDSVRQRLSDLLDGFGPVGSERREAERLNNPQVRELQRQVSEAVVKLDDDASTWQRRATRIARTETTGAFNAGQLEAGLVEGQKVKVWVALADERTRDSHLEAAGQCVPVDGAFTVGDASMQAPGVGGPASEVVNCRCQLVFASSCAEASAMVAPAAERWAEQLAERQNQ